MRVAFTLAPLNEPSTALWHNVRVHIAPVRPGRVTTSVRSPTTSTSSRLTQGSARAYPEVKGACARGARDHLRGGGAPDRVDGGVLADSVSPKSMRGLRL